MASEFIIRAPPRNLVSSLYHTNLTLSTFFVMSLLKKPSLLWSEDSLKLEVIFQNLALFFEHLFAAGVLVALRAQQIPRGSSVHRVQRLSVVVGSGKPQVE
jgi:hypothetical protein